MALESLAELLYGLSLGLSIDSYLCLAMPIVQLLAQPFQMRDLPWPRSLSFTTPPTGT